MINELSKIEKAIDLAQEIHARQYRKVSKLPYIVHPFRVYQRAKSMGLSSDIQIISILHDVYEDTTNKEYVKHKIKSLFGDIILKYILLLSHDREVEYNKYLLLLAKKSNIALTVKLLDIIENLLDNPSQKQKNKYFSGLQYLLKNNIQIDSRISDLIIRLTR